MSNAARAFRKQERIKGVGRALMESALEDAFIKGMDEGIVRAMVGYGISSFIWWVATHD